MISVLLCVISVLLCVIRLCVVPCVRVEYRKGESW